MESHETSVRIAKTSAYIRNGYLGSTSLDLLGSLLERAPIAF